MESVKTALAVEGMAAQADEQAVSQDLEFEL